MSYVYLTTFEVKGQSKYENEFSDWVEKQVGLKKKEIDQRLMHMLESSYNKCKRRGKV